jgi:hypothetical protein
MTPVISDKTRRRNSFMALFLHGDWEAETTLSDIIWEYCNDEYFVDSTASFQPCRKVGTRGETHNLHQFHASNFED